MSNSKQEKIIQCINERLPSLEDALVNSKTPAGNVRFENVVLSTDFVKKTIERFKSILDNNNPDYEGLYKSITLEMVANSKFWSELRYMARTMCL